MTRLGSNRSRLVNVRIIANSNKNLQQLADNGHFRGDLFYRLNVIGLELPPLKERREDVPLIAEYFLTTLAASIGKHFKGFSQEVFNVFNTYDWPGNVRELRNVVEHAMVFSTGKLITYQSLPKCMRKSMPLPDRISPEKRDRYLHFLQTYQALNGNVTQVAKALKVSRPTGYAWRDKLGLS